MNSEYIDNLPERIRKEISLQSYQSGDIIIEQGTTPNSVYLINSGLVKAFNINSRGQEFLFEVFGTGEYFGEMEFFTESDYLAYIKCMTDCEVYRMSYGTFNEILKNDHKLFVNLAKFMGSRMLKITERFVESSYYPLEFLFSKFLLKMSEGSEPNLIIRTRDELSNYFGTNVRSINRVIKKLAESGAIKANRDRLEIVSEEKLRSILDLY
ncbi:MAG: Crp/Fnr family transcriptional regulator [Rhodothermaceae bacterium]